MKSLAERDKAILWHPLTQEKTADLPLAIARGKGSYVYDFEGKAYLDLVSSWWVNLHGHANPVIAKAIYEQASQLEHVIFAGYTHEPAVSLCEGLMNILPSSLCRFFYSDNGSTAVEVALKMAYQFWYNQNEKQRTYFLSFEGGYHGDTFGAMAVSTTIGFHDPFEDFLFKVFSLPFPATWNNDEDIERKEQLALDVLEKYLLEYENQIAAIILEPLIQGCSGMRMCRPVFIKEVIARVKRYNILVIYDEVMTGFGRTGKHFAMDHFSIAPDFLCLSKGITGGFLPLALTVTTQTIYNAFLDESWKKAFLHSHSYTANPIACAAANASLALLLDDTTQQAIQAIESFYQKEIITLAQNYHVSNARTLGTICAFELPTIEHAQQLKKECLQEGIMIRPIGKTIYTLPPYSTRIEELEKVYGMIEGLITKKQALIF